MIIPSAPIATAPVKLITSINSLIPKRKSPKGKKQVKNQARFLERPKSYQSTFFKVKARVIKEVKQVIIPKIKPNFIILFPNICSIPDIASFDVLGPQAPKTIKMKKFICQRCGKQYKAVVYGLQEKTACPFCIGTGYIIKENTKAKRK